MSKLLNRLASQLHAKGMSKGKAIGIATNILKRRGNLTKDGKDTKSGARLGNLSAEQRSKNREAKYSGHKASDYTYSSKTNRSTLKKKLGDTNAPTS